MRLVKCIALYGSVLLVVACGSEDRTCLGEEASCATDPLERVNTESLTARIGSIRSDLGYGARGEDVVAVHDYLAQFGYFPNDELLAEYPNWRPYGTEAPSQWDFFDEQTVHAVRGLQRFAGLESTGVVDEATRRLMTETRCGVPDSFPREDPSEKFGLRDDGFRWTTSPVTWRVFSVAGANIVPAPGTGQTTLSQVNTAASAAFATWAQATSITFSNPSSGAVDIEIRFEDLNRDAAAITNSSSHDIRINNEKLWSVNSGGTLNRFDLQSVLVHEIGHAIGLQHTSATEGSPLPVMTRSVGSTPRRNLQLDDKVAASSLYDKWITASNNARDVGIGSNGSVWIISNIAVGNNFTIQRWNGSSFVTSNNGTGVRIAVAPDGRPWVVGFDGSIWRRTTTSPTTGTWDQVAGCARDIAVDVDLFGDDLVWVVGCAPIGSNFGLHRLNGSGVFVPVAGRTAVRVAAEHGTGRVWVADSAGAISRYIGFAGQPWQNVPGLARDVAGGPRGADFNGPINYAFVVGTDGKAWVFNEQVGNADDEAEPHAFTFRLFAEPLLPPPLSLGSIAVGPDGAPWVVTTSFRLLRTEK
jgi:peptidoglycan hydrolase-like protein with peptidoglycan-binding domain